MRLEDDLLWESNNRSGWGLRWLRHVTAAAVLAGFGGLLWLGGERFICVAAFCGAAVYAIWVTVHWLRDRRRFVRVTVANGGLRMQHVSGRTTDHDLRMVTRAHITHRGHSYDDANDRQKLAGAGSATLRLQIAGRRFTSRWAGLDSAELDRLQETWRATCPEAAIDSTCIPGQFAGYSY
ncbi:hypothetical protein [Actinomadura macrotermitis]|uniref:hypothetical protein n=1 Tax=Actinomadura macrotermitis TaxID=2585200 RepID=UPI00129583E5|nr:hypothetical protein [Actinomadura macrotermitis]